MPFKHTNIVRAVDPGSIAAKPEDYISMRRHWWQRLVIIKDGGIQGWFVSFLFTVFTMIMSLLGFLIGTVAENWAKFGYVYGTVYLGSTGLWLTYKIAQKKVGNGTAGFDMSSIIKTITDAMRTATKPKIKPDAGVETEGEIPK